MPFIISRIQLVYLLIWTILGTALFILPRMVAQFVVEDAWLVAVIFGACSLVMAGVFWVFVKLFPGKNLSQALEQAFGLWPGRFAILMVLLDTLLLECTLLRQVNIFMDLSVFPKMYIPLISAVFLIPLITAARHGLEVIGRTSEFITPLAIVIIMSLIGMSFRNVDLRELTPVLADGFKPVRQACIVPCVHFLLQFMLALQFATSLRKPVHLPQMLVVAGLLCGLAGIVVEVSVVGVLGRSSAYVAYPVMETTRTLRIGQFLERFDTLYVMGVLAGGFLKISLILYVMSDMGKELLRLSSHRSLVLPLGAVSWAGAILLFRNTVEYQSFLMYTAAVTTFLGLGGIPLLAMTVQGVKMLLGGKKKRRTAQPAPS